MMRMVPFELPSGAVVIGTEVKLPKTTLLAISTDRGYIMCGALDIGLLNTKLKARQIIAGRAVGVRTLEELLQAPMESITEEAKRIGVKVGMSGIDALELMS